MNYYTEVLKKYAVFDGRARRKEYWMFVLLNFIIMVILWIIAAAISVAINSQVVSTIVPLYSLAVLLPNVGVGVRRLHDIGRSGWWLLLGLIPLIGAIILLVWMATDSQPGSNPYGPNPKEITAA